MIFEDDAKFLHSITKVSLPPEKWDMLYLGGYIKERFSELNSNWDCISSWCTHAYIIHSRIYDHVLDNFDSWPKNKILIKWP